MDTAGRMLDIAERLAQTRGFNGFSYSDIAAELGIAKASLHHHFATKAELGRALMQRYTEGFEAALAGIDGADEDAFAKLGRYVRLYEDVLSNDRLCLCGMLAAEYSTLPKEMRAQVRLFFEKNEMWLAALIERGRREKVLRSGAPARDVARMIVSALEGAMLLARSCEDPGRFASSVRPILAELKAKRVRKKKPAR
jgi:TetR/AcrR family transcriptional repressor of nem operon